MKLNHYFPRLRRQAFTLVELLVVMAIIAALAAILFPVFSGIKKSGAIKKTRAQLQKVVLAIEAYKAQHGHYPQDNPDNPAVNPLFYELAGTKLIDGKYQTETGEGNLSNGDLPTFFGGPRVSGFVNVSRGSGDEAQNAKNYLVGISASDYLAVVTNNVTGIVLGTSIKGPVMLTATNDASINPFRYVSTGPTNNPNHFDLWVDIIVGGKTNRISNWREKEQIVP
ncbi:MAG TPA: type II secretion system protein [Verrucomicrobiae bacterium]|nr:type II secretion system protein [Verrucomicrobiae bacterium]